MATVADATNRARQAFKRLGGGRLAEPEICLACGRPVAASGRVRLHGVTYHSSCIARTSAGAQKA